MANLWLFPQEVAHKDGFAAFLAGFNFNIRKWDDMRIQRVGFDVIEREGGDIFGFEKGGPLRRWFFRERGV